MEGEVEKVTVLLNFELLFKAIFSKPDRATKHYNV